MDLLLYMVVVLYPDDECGLHFILAAKPLLSPHLVAAALNTPSPSRSLCRNIKRGKEEGERDGDGEGDVGLWHQPQHLFNKMALNVIWQVKVAMN
jgi:hypothetical protein